MISKGGQQENKIPTLLDFNWQVGTSGMLWPLIYDGDWRCHGDVVVGTLSDTPVVLLRRTIAQSDAGTKMTDAVITGGITFPTVFELVSLFSSTNSYPAILSCVSRKYFFVGTCH